MSHRSWNSDVSPPITLFFIRTNRRKRTVTWSELIRSSCGFTRLPPAFSGLSSLCLRAEWILPTNVNLLLSVSEFHLFTKFINFQTRISFCSRHTAQICISCMDFASHSVLMGLHSSLLEDRLQERASVTASVFQSSGSSADLSASRHQLMAQFISTCVLEAVVAFSYSLRFCKLLCSPPHQWKAGAVTGVEVGYISWTCHQPHSGSYSNNLLMTK